MSEAATVFDPQRLKEIIGELGERLEPLAQEKRLQNIKQTITLVDGSLIAALPRIMEASFRKASTGNGMTKWRLHTHFEVLRGIPSRIDITPNGGGDFDERAVLASVLEPDRLYVTREHRNIGAIQFTIKAHSITTLLARRRFSKGQGMARVNRREVLADGDVQVVHCINRCVRRGFLCGDDAVTGKNYDHRRQWIQNRLEFLAGVFGVELLGFSVMSNHFHCVLRTRPDVVAEWSDEEVARRWWRLFPKRRNEDGSPCDPTDADLLSIHGDKSVLAERRLRLSSVSWFMRCTSEVIARMSNAEDECTGRFWEGRFKAKVLDSEEAVAACMVYVDLNPIRAGIADSPEKSDYTSIQARISDAKSADEVSTSDAKDARTEHGRKAGWLAPIPLEPPRAKARDRKTSRRVSNKGCLPMSFADYLILVEWTGRQLHAGKRGYIKSSVPPLLDRLGTSPEFWLESIKKLEPRNNVQSKKNSLTNAVNQPTHPTQLAW